MNNKQAAVKFMSHCNETGYCKWVSRDSYVDVANLFFSNLEREQPPLRQLDHMEVAIDFHTFISANYHAAHMLTRNELESLYHNWFMHHVTVDKHYEVKPDNQEAKPQAVNISKLAEDVAALAMDKINSSLGYKNLTMMVENQKKLVDDFFEFKKMIGERFKEMDEDLPRDIERILDERDTPDALPFNLTINVSK